MAAASFTVTGDKAMILKFNSLHDQLQRRSMRSALRKVAKPIIKDAMAATPVRTGNLQKSIGVRKVWWSKSDGAMGVSIGPRNDDQFGGAKYYAHLVEGGTSKVPARPFLRPALDKAGPTTMAVMSAAIRAYVEKHGAKYA